MMRRILLPLVLTVAVPGLATAQAVRAGDSGLSRIEQPLELPAVDRQRADLADWQRIESGDGVAHYAVPVDVDVNPSEDGEWERVGDEVRWRFEIVSRGALSLNLAFDRYRMPEGGSLLIYSPDGRHRIGFSEADNEEHRQLWTPPLFSDHLVLELVVPLEDQLEIDDLELELELSRVHVGYAGFGQPEPKSGSCQRDVACSETAIWQDVARSVALVSVEGVRFCSGFLVNNTSLDGRPFFVTARHCGVTAENAPSVVVMWNHASTLCPDEDDPPPALDPASHFQTGATLLASYEPSDFVLLELDDPPEPEWNVHYAGWDRSRAEPESTTAIHHPNTDRKRISFDYERPDATAYLEREILPDADHLRVASWDVGTTEGGSSGGPLFNQDQRVIGQLHGGYAACGNGSADWFGRLAASWDGGGTRSTRLRDWLDPLATDAVTLDGLNASDLPE